MKDDVVTVKPRRKLTKKLRSAYYAAYGAALRANPATKQANWDALDAQLFHAARGGKISLTLAQWQFLYEVLQGKRKRPRGRPVDPHTEGRAMGLAMHCIALVLDGKLPKNAVSDTKDYFGVSKSAVYAAVQRFGPELGEAPLGWSPEFRQLTFEVSAKRVALSSAKSK